MQGIVSWLEEIFRLIPLPLLQTWGRLGYIAGFVLALAAFGGFTFRLGERWGIGRERQAWDAKAFAAIPTTFLLIIASGYLGSFIVLVPGAQTFESIKDLVVFLCIVLFGYPALITVPFAYGLSDLIEGVPPDSLLSWLPGYFINPACFWIAYQLLGKNPDFRQAPVWGKYLLFVLCFLSIEPVLWGYICADKFSAEISYRNITPALLFTTSITWLLVPFTMLGAFPLAQRFGLFWAAIPGHVKESALGHRERIWVAGKSTAVQEAPAANEGLPLRMLILTPFIVLILVMVGMTAYVSLGSAEEDANKLAARLHREIATNIDLQLDEYFASGTVDTPAEQLQYLRKLLAALPIAAYGRALLIDRFGNIIESSAAPGDDVAASAIAELSQRNLNRELQFPFVHVTAKPLARETWLAQAVPYRDRAGGHSDWIVLTAMPEAFYLAGVRTGNSRSALVFALALLFCLAVAAPVASMVTSQLRRVSEAIQALARDDLPRRVPGSYLEELSGLADSFNDMAVRLKQTIGDLRSEVQIRKDREQELAASEARVRASEKRLQLAVQAGQLGIWDWDIQQGRLNWDDYTCQLYGLRPEAFGGTYEDWSRCVEPEDLPKAQADVAAALRGEREFASEFRVRWPDGSLHYVRGMAQTLRGADGQPLRMVGINWDVTERLAAERELRRHRDHLEELVAARTDALAVAAGEAQAANRAKSSFLASMSHEIRTPLNIILGYAQLLSRDSSLALPQRRKIDVIHSSGNHLLALLNNVLEMSKIEVGRTELLTQTFDLHALLQDIEVMFHETLAGKGIELAFELCHGAPQMLITDAGKVRQVLINLVGNAAKFTSAGCITVTTSTQPLSSEAVLVRIDVTDTGAGIAPENLERIFIAFDQTELGTRAGGSGLGLTISQSFARLMQGDLTVSSQLGMGSTFTFTFAATLASTGRDASDRPMPLRLDADRVPPKVLIVDDIKFNRDLLQDLLTKLGFETRVACDGFEALQVHADWHPDLILMDLRMPRMDGLETMRHLRAEGARVKIVALTASGLAETESQTLAAGANDFLRKPYREVDLLEKLGRLLELRYLYSDQALATPGG